MTPNYLSELFVKANTLYDTRDKCELIRPMNTSITYKLRSFTGHMPGICFLHTWNQRSHCLNLNLSLNHGMGWHVHVSIALLSEILFLHIAGKGICRRDGLVVSCGVVTVTTFLFRCSKFTNVTEAVVLYTFWWGFLRWIHWRMHYNDAIMNTMACQITSLTIVYSTVYSGADQRKHQSSASLAFVRVIHRGPVNSSHKWPVTRKMFPFDDVIIVFMTVAWGWRRFSFQWITTELLMKPHRLTDTLSVIPLYGRTAI